MNEKIAVDEVDAEVEVEGIVDLGDAAVETRVYHPAQVITDSSFQLGRAFFE